MMIAFQVLEHRPFHFRLPYSDWCHVLVIHGGDSLVALVMLVIVLLLSSSVFCSSCQPLL